MALVRNDQPVAQINITPLVDVLLVLLVIFMIVAPIISRPIRLDLPVPDRNPRLLVTEMRLQVDSIGGFRLDGRVVAHEQLTRTLSHAAEQNPQLRLRIAAVSEGEYQGLVRALAAAEQAGIRNVGIEVP